MSRKLTVAGELNAARLLAAQAAYEEFLKRADDVGGCPGGWDIHGDFWCRPIVWWSNKPDGAYCVRFAPGTVEIVDEYGV